MMIKPRIETVRDKADSRYTLVILAAKRARDLIDGKPALIEDDQQKPVTIAANEIADELITYDRAEEDEYEDAPTVFDFEVEA